MHTVCLLSGNVSWLCIMAMYHGCVSRLCIMAMYHGYVSAMQRIQEGQFLKNALDLVLIVDSESTQKSVQIRTGIIDLQNDFNMFVAKQWKNIISVPMSYINVGRRKKVNRPIFV